MKFGTDGIRGPVGELVHEDLARGVGNAAVQVLGERLLVARDTRPSSLSLAMAAMEGIARAGGQGIDLGVLPTPGLSAAILGMEADGGLMITASHNPEADNGVKALGSRGKKLDRAHLAALSAAMTTPSEKRGGTRREETGAGRAYVKAVLAALPPGRWLTRRRILLDAAGGAASEVAPLVLDALGADVTLVDAGPINATGVMAPELAKAAVARCEAGILLDGDGDRVAVLTADGEVVDGDALLWALRRGTVVVGTVMSNGGLQIALATEGIRFVRSAVGDANVADAMAQHGALVGGEPSGHILFADGLPTSDGLLTALRAFSALRELPHQTARAALTGYVPFHQAHGNVRADVRIEGVKGLVADMEAAGARVIVRASGTEPVVRVMVEHREAALAQAGLKLLTHRLLEGA